MEECDRRAAARAAQVQAHYDQHARPLPKLCIGATVRIQDPVSLRWDKSEHPSLIDVVQLDVTSEGAVQAAAQHIQQTHGKALDLLINCSAILSPSGRGETSLRDVSMKECTTRGGVYDEGQGRVMPAIPKHGASKSRASVRRWSTTRHKSGTGVPTTAQLRITNFVEAHVFHSLQKVTQTEEACGSAQVLPLLEENQTSVS
ncbi:uncharacterized protein LOC123499838 isoform X2 [Portunus trituberculatus]|uniref:uncharacterized protein LOC123499838 isoform X2 n=1 Tax=Portunus trituberculatus TaxID=210409 RepID=UPI001E1CC635|nr:uncharacterized protein LOC123499838 isoform X2 [Portunus trituberculatus]